MRRFMALICLLVTFLAHGLQAAASPDHSVSRADALKAAAFLVAGDSKWADSGWRGGAIRLSKGLEVYDLAGALMGYRFDIWVGQQHAGYVLAGNNLDEFPILAFTYKAELTADDLLNSLRTHAQGPAAQSRLVFANGQFGLQIVRPDARIDNVGIQQGVLSDGQNSVRQQPDQSHAKEARAFWAEVKKAGRLSATSLDGGYTPVNPDDFEKGWQSTSSRFISGVPDWNQWIYHTDSNGRKYYTGCSPTAGANIAQYWAWNGYPNMSRDGYVPALRTAMGTTNTTYTASCSCYMGLTPLLNISPGLQRYARDRGYASATASYVANPSFTAIKSEVNTGRPGLLSMFDHEYYGGKGAGHTVTIVGYKEYWYSGSSAGHQYITIHDGWENTPTDVYIAYGRNYSSIHLHTLRMN